MWVSSNVTDDLPAVCTWYLFWCQRWIRYLLNRPQYVSPLTHPRVQCWLSRESNSKEVSRCMHAWSPSFWHHLGYRKWVLIFIMWSDGYRRFPNSQQVSVKTSILSPHPMTCRLSVFPSLSTRSLVDSPRPYLWYYLDRQCSNCLWPLPTDLLHSVWVLFNWKTELAWNCCLPDCE
jgi:hypothetical protein